MNSEIFAVSFTPPPTLKARRYRFPNTGNVLKSETPRRRRTSTRLSRQLLDFCGTGRQRRVVRCRRQAGKGARAHACRQRSCLPALGLSFFLGCSRERAGDGLVRRHATSSGPGDGRARRQRSCLPTRNLSDGASDDLVR